MSLVFISHAAEDGALAVQLAQGLEAAGYPTWYYERDSLPGPSYLEQILHALDRSAAVVALLSPASLASWQVDKEIVQAHERGLAFVPLLRGLSYEQMRERRPAWAMAFGAAVALPLPADDVASVLPQVMAGLRWLAGERPASAPGPAMGRLGPSSPSSRFDNLPLPPTLLLGREQAMAQLAALLRQPEVRLLTLTGPGGVGKTRLALAVAAEVRASFADGVCFVDLAPLADAALVLATIAQALGITEAGSQSLEETLRAALRERNVLLLLDNVEQVVASAPDIAALLAACPRLTMLATSRVPLHLRGEREVAVPPLAVPDPAQLPPLDALAQIPAVTLFVQRAQEARAGFVLSDANARPVAQICRRLDGLPLAIELAAARAKLLPPPALLARLDKRLGLLTGGARDLPERQRTLRATIDWSHGLLAGPEQTLFARLSVFVGGRTLEAIEAVCNAEGTLDMLAGVEALLANSLLGQSEADGESRFTMLETIQEYARERLEARGETATLRQAHAQYYLELAEEAAPGLQGPEQATWLGRLEREHDNLRAALRWAVGSDQELGDQSAMAWSREQAVGEVGLRLAAALWRFWYARGYLSEGRHWLDAVLGGRGETPAARATALNGAGVLAIRQGDYGRATALLEESLAQRRELGDTRGIAASLNNLGTVAWEQGDYGRATVLLEESLARRRELGDTRGMAVALDNLGLVACDQGDYARATALLEEALALDRESEDTGGIALLLSNLGNVAFEQGDYARAAALQEEGLALRRELGDTGGIALLLSNLGSVAFEQGDDARAIALQEEALALRRELGDQRGIALSLSSLGVVAFEQGDYGRATALVEEGLALCRTIGAKGLSASCLEELAGIAGVQGQPERAARLFGAAEAVRRLIHAPMPPNARPRHERLVAAARAKLDARAFAAAWAAGEALSLEQAIAEALHEAA